MTVQQLMDELSKLPPEANIGFESYTESFSAEVRWDITMDKYKEGYMDEPYIYLTPTRTKGRWQN